MRAGRPIATLLLAMGLAAAVSGCEAVQQASDTANQVGQAADKAQLCIEALKLAGFTPDATDPQKALEETQKKAEELNARLTEILGRTPSYHAAQAYAGIITAVDALSRAESGSRIRK